MSQGSNFAERIHSRVADFIAQCREYFGLGGKVLREPIENAKALRAFLESRASFIAQTSLYGYLRTRAGMRYPELFDDATFVASINIAKWHMWKASLSDLTVYAGGLLAHAGMSAERTGTLMQCVVDEILQETGSPDEAGGEFAEHAQRVRSRIALTSWQTVEDNENCFHESPTALVKWAPVVEHLKQLDEAIVRNSVRFHWQEVRRELRQYLDAAAVARAAPF